MFLRMVILPINLSGYVSHSALILSSILSFKLLSQVNRLKDTWDGGAS